MTVISLEFIKKYDKVALKITRRKGGVRRKYMVPVVNVYID